MLWCCWLGGGKGIRPVKTEWWDAGVVICLGRGADLRKSQLMPLPLTVSCFSKIQIGLPFWYRLTRVVLDKGLLNVCVCSCAVSRPFLGRVVYRLSASTVSALYGARRCRRDAWVSRLPFMHTGSRNVRHRSSPTGGMDKAIVRQITTAEA